MAHSAEKELRGGQNSDAHRYLRQAAGWVDLHRPRNEGELRRTIVHELGNLLGPISFALATERDGGEFYIEASGGPDAPPPPGALLPEGSWPPKGGVTFPLLFDQYEIGHLALTSPPNEDTAKLLEVLLLHYATAKVNLLRNEESQRSLEHYCSSLKIFEEGVVLFQEQDPEAMAARLLQLCMQSLGAVAGAVYVFEDVENPKSELFLDQAVGMPAELLERIVTVEGEWWPSKVRGTKPVYLARDGAGTFPGLDSEKIPEPMRNIVSAPLTYHGVEVGLCVLCNVADKERNFEAKLAVSQHLFELGAAVIHRRELEKRALRSRELSTQLEIASVVQQRLLPKEPPSNEHLSFAWRSQMSQQVGGDYLDLLSGESGDVFAIIADVSGHGVNSALLMTSFRASYRSNALWLEPEILLTEMNHIVREEIEGTGMFLTAATLRIDPEDRSFVFASAGHNPIYLYKPGEDRFVELEATGPPLGMFEGMTYETTRTPTDPGDFLVLYTDGVTEAQDARKISMFGEERLKELIRRGEHRDPKRFVDRLYEELVRFTGTTEQTDDISVLAIRFL